MSREVNSKATKDFMSWLTDVGRTHSTIYSYRSTMITFNDWLGEKSNLKVTLLQIEQFLYRPRPTKTGKASPATIQREAAVIKTFCRWASGKGLITTNPTELLVLPKVHNIQPKALDDNVWVKLWERAEDFDPFDTFILGAGYYLGLRRAEMTKLHTDHVDLDGERFINFNRKGGGNDTLKYGSMLNLFEARKPKTAVGIEPFREAMRKLVELSEGGYMLFDLLHRYRYSSRWDELPDGQWAPDRVNGRVRAMCKASGLSAFGPHALRHSCATNLVQMDVPLHVVASLLNHSSITMTMRYVKLGSDPLADLLAS